ncbi:MAG: hypothetical protein Q8R35_02255 [bacterium]|nr:hypothetical protein [bacterium]
MRTVRYSVMVATLAGVLVLAAGTGVSAASTPLTKQREANIRGSFIHMIERADAAIERLHKISSRIQSRISRMRVDDANRETVQAARDAADAKLRAAAAALADLKLKLERTRTNPDPRDAFRRARRMVGEVKDGAEGAHGAFTAALGRLEEALRAPGSS